MAVLGIYIQKTIPWRGQPATIGNTYHFQADTFETFDDVGMINEIVRAEKLIHATNVQFVKARSWGPTDQGPAASKMREVITLTGSGSGSPTASFYPEMAVMCYWPLGRYGSKNRPQYLRKWLHLGRNGGLPSDGSRAATTAFADIQGYISSVTTLDPTILPGNYALCTEAGTHEAAPGSGQIYPYLEHRQIGR